MGETLPLSVPDELTIVAAMAPLIKEGYASYRELFLEGLTVKDYFMLLRLRDWNNHTAYLASQAQR